MIAEQWDGNPMNVKMRHWLAKEIPGWVRMYDPATGVLSVQTLQGEKYVPNGWWIVKNDDGTVIISPEGPDGIG